MLSRQDAGIANLHPSLMLRLRTRTARFYGGTLGNSHRWVAALPGRCSARTLASSRQDDEPESRCEFNKSEAQDDSKITVNWYEQLFPGLPHSRRRIDPSREDGGDNSELVQRLQAKVKQLTAEIAQMRDPNTFIATLPEEEQAGARNAMIDAKDGETSLFEHDVSLMDLPKLAKLERKLDLSPQQTVYLKILDKCLREAADDIENTACRSKLWRAYNAAKRNLPPFLNLVPDSIYKVLFESEERADDAHRSTHVYELAADVLTHGKRFTTQQALLYIDSLLDLGRVDQALAQWESHKARLLLDEDARDAFGYLGIKLFAKDKKPEQAQQLALELLPRIDQDLKVTIFIPVLETWAKEGSENSLTRAWTLYVHLRKELGPSLRVQDYDSIITSFLKCGRSQLALAVFKDLTICGHGDQHGSVELYNKVVGDMQRQSGDTVQLNKISLMALTALPPKFQNKFFYASWLRRLLAEGEVDMATSVVELMIERDVKPDAKHLNGIIGAWLRSGSATERAKGDQLAWSMIHRRLQLVKERQGLAVEQIDIDGKTPSFTLKISSSRIIPSATIETFCLLLLNYERRGLKKQVDLLKMNLAKAEIHPNSYWMNHLMYAELRDDRSDRAWDIYSGRPQYVIPDMETFACLWDCKKRNSDKILYHSTQSFPGGRQLLHEMIFWYSTVGQAGREKSRRVVTKDMYHQIIRCMCLARDFEGTIVALYALKNIFQVYPDSDTARLITIQAARCSFGEAAPQRRRRRSSTAQSQSKNNFQRMKQLLELVREQRAEKLHNQGVNSDSFSEERKGQEMIIVLAKFLHTIILHTAEDQDVIVPRMRKAGEEIGVRMDNEILEIYTA